MGEHGVSSSTNADGGCPRGSGWPTFRALRHRNYRLFFLGQTISLIGTSLQTTALLWLPYQLTGTSLWPSLVLAAQLLPAFLLGVWGGVLADRLPKRGLIIATQTALMGLALLLAGLTYAGMSSPWPLLVVAACTGIVHAVDLPARLSFLTEMVGKEDVVNAVGLNSTLFNMARVAGPALGILILPHWGAGVCFLINGLSFVAVLAALVGMKMPTVRLGRSRTSEWNAMVAGIRFVVGHPSLRILLPITAVMAMFGWPLLGLLPALAEENLHSNGEGYSSLLSALGVGAFLAALLVASFGSFSRRRLFLGLGVAVASAAMLLLSQASSLTVAVVCCGVVGIGLIMFFATSQAVFQLSAGDDNRGRVMGIYSMVLTGAQPVGNLLAGPTADRWGVPAVVGLMGTALVGGVALILILHRLYTGAQAASIPNTKAVKGTLAGICNSGDHTRSKAA